LAGLCPGADDAPGDSSAIVIADPGGRARRFLRTATGALAQNDAAGLGTEHARRADSMLAALALSGPGGTTRTDLFAAVYGFAYRERLHRGAFDVSLHRARALLADFGEVVSEEGRLRLKCNRVIKISDPRCVLGPEDRVLAQVARCEVASARDIAANLRIPLRTAQQSLRSLVESGACRMQRSGRQVLYAVEDTTFQEPTHPR
jgi:hypothetical protein